MKNTKHIANEAAPSNAASGPMVVWGANSLDSVIAGGWVQLAPYGDWDNPAGMQRFQMEDAEAIVSDFRSIGNVGAAVMGLPWYIGHPDHPAFANRDRDGKAYGRIKDLEARPDGLYARVKWSANGKSLIEEQAFHGHSVNWRLVREGSVWRPRSLKSVGFTNEPNIPVAPVTAANQKQHMQKLKELFGLGNEATEEDIEKAANAALEKMSKLEANMEEAKKAANMYEDEAEKEKEASNAKILKLEADLKSATSERDAANARQSSERETIDRLTKERDEASTNFANERNGRIKAIVDAGIRDGKITGSDRDKWEKDFANEFAATLEKLATAASGLPSGSQVDGKVTPGAPKGASQTKSGTLLSMVNERMTKNGVDYDTAFAQIANENPGLLGEMKQPESSRRELATA